MPVHGEQCASAAALRGAARPSLFSLHSTGPAGFPARGLDLRGQGDPAVFSGQRDTSPCRPKAGRRADAPALPVGHARPIPGSARTMQDLHSAGDATVTQSCSGPRAKRAGGGMASGLLAWISGGLFSGPAPWPGGAARDQEGTGWRSRSRTSARGAWGCSTSPSASPSARWSASSRTRHTRRAARSCWLSVSFRNYGDVSCKPQPPSPRWGRGRG